MHNVAHASVCLPVHSPSHSVVTVNWSDTFAKGRSLLSLVSLAVSTGSLNNGSGQIPNVLLQALLNRMDHLEFTLLRESHEDISELHSAVSSIQRTRRAQVEETEQARARQRQ